MTLCKDAGQHSGEEQVSDRDPDPGRCGIDDHVVRGRDQQADDRRGHGDINGIVARIALVLHQRDHGRADRRGAGDGRSRHRAEHHRGADIDDTEAATNPADRGIGDPDEALGNARAIHQVTRKDEEGDRHQREDADARCDTLDRDDGRDVHREETGECCCEQRKGHRHTDNEQSKEHAEQDKQFHQPSPSPAESSAMCRPLMICGSANSAIRRPETGSGT